MNLQPLVLETTALPIELPRYYITGSFFTVLIKSQMYKFAEPILNLEEDVRFELTVPFETSVFKTDAIGHSANLPLFFIYYHIETH